MVAEGRHGMPLNYYDPCLALDKEKINPIFLVHEFLFN